MQNTSALYTVIFNYNKKFNLSLIKAPILELYSMYIVAAEKS